MERRGFSRGLLGAALAAGMQPLLAENASSSTMQQSRDLLDWLPAEGSITDVAGIKVGHCTLKQRPTGCTVVLCEGGAVGGVDVRGSAPGTRETDLLNPINTVQQVQAVMLSGGSAYGLDTATGAMRYLEERGLGYKVGAAGVIPIVPAAILFDLNVGDSKIRPNAESGYQACLAASSNPPQQGSVGAGAGATVGKMFGQQFAMKSGVGTASAKLGDTGIVVGALVAVNAVGDVINPKTGAIVAGARSEDGHGFRNSMQQLLHGYAATLQRPVHTNTTIGVVATNATLDKAQMTKIAQMAHDGYARSVNPTHTPVDGDAVFALSTRTLKAQVNHGVLGAVAAEVMAQAVIRAVVHAEGLPGLPSYRQLHR